MRRFYTDKEIQEKLKNILVLCDTREQVNGSILSFLDKKKIPYTKRKLDVGDYSFMVGDDTFEDVLCVERKANLDELAGNITVDRSRLENEFLRAKARGTRVVLLIEGASWEDIRAHNYISRLDPKSFLGTLFSWQDKYNLQIIFCKPEETGSMIYSLFYYRLRNWLKGD